MSGIGYGGTVKRRTDGQPGYIVRYQWADGSWHKHSELFSGVGKKWLDNWNETLRNGTVIMPADADLTVQQWCDRWLDGYHGADGTIKCARTHLRLICAKFGPEKIDLLRTNDIDIWLNELRTKGGPKGTGYAPEYIKAVYRRTRQVLGGALVNNVVKKNVATQKTPRGGKQKPYVITTAQMWDLYDIFPERLRVGILLGAFGGLRIAEACAYRPADVDFLEGIIACTHQWGPNSPDEHNPVLKNDAAYRPVEITSQLATMLLETDLSRPTFLSTEWGDPAGPHNIQVQIRHARAKLGLSPKFSFHDLRHYKASQMLSEVVDIYRVRDQMRHDKIETTIATYGHLMKDAKTTARDAQDQIFAARSRSVSRSTSP